MGSYCACALSWPLLEVSIRGAGQKDRSSGDKNAPRQTQTVKNKRKHVLILVLPCFFDNVDSKVEYRSPLSFKRQSNLHLWPLFDEKL